MHGFKLRLTLFLLKVLAILALSGQVADSHDTTSPSYYYGRAEKLLEANDLNPAFYNFHLAAKGFEESGELKNLIRSLLQMSDIKRIRQDFDSTELLLKQSWDVLNEAGKGYEALLADYYLKSGTLKLNKGLYEEATTFYQKSLQTTLEHSGPGDTTLVMVYNNLGITAYQLGLYEQSLEYYSKAREIIDLGQISKNKHVGFTYQNLGIYYATLGNYELAGQYFSKTLEIFSNLFDENDSRLGRYYLNYGRMLLLTGHMEEALSLLKRAEQIIQKNFGPDYTTIGLIMMNKAAIYTSFSDYERAFNYTNRALAILLKNFPNGHPDILRAYLNLGHYHEIKENYEGAIEFYKMSIDRDRAVPANIKTYRNMARIFNNQGKKEEADRYYSLAIDESIRIFGNEHPETAHSYVNYARFLTQHHSYSKSQELLGRAINIYLKTHGPKHREYSNALSWLGNNYFEKGEYLNALSEFQRAIIAISYNFENTDPFSNPNPDQLLPDHFLLNALFAKAGTLHELHRKQNSKPLLVASLETYELSVTLINKIRNSFLSEESRLIITGITSGVLTGALDCSIDLFNLTRNPDYLEKAFMFSEKGKAAMLLASMHDIEARQLTMIPEEVQKLEKTLNQSLESYNQLIYEERLTNRPDEAKISLWQSKTFGLKMQYDSLVQSIYQEYPDYYELKFDLNTIPLAHLQASLSNDQLFIEYTVGSDHLFMFGISSDTIIVHKDNLDDNFQKDLDAFRRQLAGSNLQVYKQSDYLEFVRLSHSIYQKLIGPLEEQLQGRRLIIVPDNQLGYLPFEVLITKEVTETSIDFSGLPYLIKTHPVSYAYSATLNHKKTNRQQSKTNRKILAFAPDYFYSGRPTGSAQRHQLLMPIPWAAEEVNNLTRTYRGVAFTGAEATETLFKQKAGEYKILHLAMHTIIDNENPMYSRLIFAAPQDSIDDGMLNTFELFNLELNAHLAVLSACQTGDGRLRRGEGIMSMARGFFYAGVPSIIMTLWEVDDQSSSHLIALFYEYLAKGLSKDDALRKAKLDYLNSTDKIKSHPHFWAGFVSIGNAKPVNLQKSSPVWQISAIAFSLILLVAVYLLSRNRQDK